MSTARFNQISFALATACMCLAALFSSAGCSSGDDIVPEPVVHTPLELDPTEDLTIGNWWVGDDRLIQLKRDGTYAVHAGGTRFSLPIEYGRWSRHGNYVIRLDPYQPLDASPTSLRMNRIDGRLVAQRPGEELLYAHNVPPAEPEDALLGVWKSEIGVLRLNADLSYVVAPRSDLPQGQRPQAFLRHVGIWSLKDEVLTLRRSSPENAMEALRVAVSTENESKPTIRLVGDEATYVLVDPAVPGS